MSFNENLKKYRLKAGFKSAKRFAESLNIPYTTYMGYENKNSWPPEKILVKLANALSIDVNTLIGFQPIKEDEVKYAHRMLKDYNNFVVGDDTILYGYLTEHQLMGLDRSRKYEPVIEIPKEVFIQLIKKSKLQAEEIVNLNIERWFKEDFNNALNRNCYEYFYSTKK